MESVLRRHYPLLEILSYLTPGCIAKLRQINSEFRKQIDSISI